MFRRNWAIERDRCIELFAINVEHAFFLSSRYEINIEISISPFGKVCLPMNGSIKSVTPPSVSLETSVFYTPTVKFRIVLWHVEILREQVEQRNDELLFTNLEIRYSPFISSSVSTIFTDIKQAFLENIARLSVSTERFQRNYKTRRATILLLKKKKKKEGREKQSTYIEKSYS